MDKKLVTVIVSLLLLVGCELISPEDNNITIIPEEKVEEYNSDLLESEPIPDKRTSTERQFSFNQAKKVLPQIFQDNEETFYCGCSYQDKTVDLESCGYQIRKNEIRARRVEWEHVVPAWVIGHQLQCWQNGGRKNCTKNDEIFKYAEGDLNNLVPSIGEVNGDRSNYSFSQWTNNPDMYGQCQTVIDFKRRKIQPRAEIRGRVARIYFYMSEKYQLRLSKQDKQLFCAWAKQYPIDEWEINRNDRIVSIQGVGNNYISEPDKISSMCKN